MYNLHVSLYSEFECDHVPRNLCISRLVTPVRFKVSMEPRWCGTCIHLYKITPFQIEFGMSIIIHKTTQKFHWYRNNFHNIRIWNHLVEEIIWDNSPGILNWSYETHFRGIFGLEVICIAKQKLAHDFFYFRRIYW